MEVMKMPTKKPRLNVVLEHEVYQTLSKIAKKKGNFLITFGQGFDQRVFRDI